MNYNRTFVTWAFIEDHLLKFTSKNASDEYTSILKSVIQKADGEGPIEILNFPELRSCDLDVCILPGQESILEDAQVVLSNKKNYSIIKNSSKNHVGNTKHEFYTSDSRFDNFAVPGSKNRGYLRNIAVNTSFIESVYDSLGTEPTLNGFINKLLFGINAACGMLWDFSMVSLPYEADKLTIVDNRCINSEILGYENAPSGDYPYLIQNHFLKGFTIATNLADSISTRAYLTSIGSSYGYSTSEANTFDFYGLNEDVDGNQITITDKLRKNERGDVNKDAPTKLDDDKNPIVKSTKQNPILDYFNQAYIYLNTGHNKNKAKSALTLLVAELLNGSSKLKYRPLIGLTVSFTIPGVTGIYMGNAFTLLPISQGGWLPDRYYEQVLFQMHEINHTIDNTKWETNVSALMRHKQEIDTTYFQDDDSALQAYIDDEEIVENDFKEPEPPPESEPVVEDEVVTPPKPELKLRDGEYFNYETKVSYVNTGGGGAGVRAVETRTVRVTPIDDYIKIYRLEKRRTLLGNWLAGRKKVFIGDAYFDENGRCVDIEYWINE